jgi:phage repressor protein C with HTH and peptisase S24 domain
MAPTLRHGDALLVRPTDSVRAGDLVIGRFPDGPDLLVVKRAIRPAGAGWWLEGDNPLVTDDSRAYGPGTVLAKVLFRYWPPHRR